MFLIFAVCTQLASSTCFHAPMSHYGHTHNVAAAQTCCVLVWFVCQPIHCALLFCAMCSKNLQPTTKISSALLYFVLHPRLIANFFLTFSLQIFLYWKKHIICSDIKGKRWENFGLLQLYVFCSPINENEAHNEKQKKNYRSKTKSNTTKRRLTEVHNKVAAAVKEKRGEISIIWRASCEPEVSVDRWYPSIVQRSLKA